MQLLYGNDGINYCTISRSSDMTEEVANKIAASYSGFEFVQNTRLYSVQPECITYAIDDLNGKLDQKHVILCKNGLIENIASPSYYTHCILEPADDEFFQNHFFRIFNYHFLPYQDIDTYKTKNIGSYTYFDPDYKIVDRLALTAGQLKVILAIFMNNESNFRKTNILVDECGNNYNVRSREILASIYFYLSPGLRKSYGFKSFCQNPESVLLENVSFLLFNPNEMDKLNKVDNLIHLDLTLKDIEGSIPAKYIEYASFLVDATPEVRQQHFNTIDTLIKNGRVYINDCVSYFTNIYKWENDTQEQSLKEWIEYNYKNYFFKSPLYFRFLDLIGRKVDNQYYNNYLFEEVLEKNHETLTSLSSYVEKVILFANAVESLKIDENRFHEWHVVQLKNQLSQLENKTASNKVRLFKSEIEVLNDLNKRLKSDKLSLVLRKEIEYLNQSIEENDQVLKHEIQMEKEDIQRHFRSRNLRGLSLPKMFNHLQEYLESLQYVSYTENVVFEEWALWLENNFSGNFKDMEDWTAYDQEIERGICLFNDADLSLMNPIRERMEIEKERLQTEQERLEREKEKRIFILTHDTVLECYKRLCQLLNEYSPNDLLKLSFGDLKDQVTLEEFNDIFQFIFMPETIPFEKVEFIFSPMISEKLLRVQHAKCIIQSRVCEHEHVRRLIEYYFIESRHVEISASYFAKLLLSTNNEQLINQVSMDIREYRKSELDEQKKRALEEIFNMLSGNKLDKSARIGGFFGKKKK